MINNLLTFTSSAILIINLYLLFKLNKSHRKIDHHQNKVLNEALTKSQQIIADTQTLKTSTEKQFLELYQQLFQNLIPEAKKNLSRDLETLTQKEFQQVKLEIDDYKKSQLSRIDRSMERILNTVTREVISKGIVLNDQEELAIEALKKAEVEGLFDFENHD